MKKIIAAVYMFTRALHLSLWTQLWTIVLGELASSLTLGGKEGKDDHHHVGLCYEE